MSTLKDIGFPERVGEMTIYPEDYRKEFGTTVSLNWKALGNALAAERNAQGLFQKDIGLRCSLSESTISRCEKGTTTNIHAYLAYAAALGKQIALI